MYLHRDRETFRDIVEQAADSSGRTPAVVEKDYYVTLMRLFAILRKKRRAVWY